MLSELSSDSIESIASVVSVLESGSAVVGSDCTNLGCSMSRLSESRVPIWMKRFDKHGSKVSGIDVEWLDLCYTLHRNCSPFDANFLLKK